MAKDDKKIKKEVEEKIKFLEKKINEEKIKATFCGRHDKKNAIMSIYAGTGGKDAEDWAGILLRMYQKYFQKRGFRVKEISKTESEAGIKSTVIEIKGNYAFGWLKGESGVHRLVRISPFSSKKLRHTSFALVEILPEIEGDEVEIRDEDLKIDTFRASGPGGQHVNRRESAVRITHLPTGISVSSQSGRLQGENKKRAMMVLKAKLFLLAERNKRKEAKEERGELKMAEWGNQIRSYIFHPYQMVKDHRTNIKTSNLEKVLDGDLDKFIN